MKIPKWVHKVATFYPNTNKTASKACDLSMSIVITVCISAGHALSAVKFKYRWVIKSDIYRTVRWLPDDLGAQE